MPRFSGIQRTTSQGGFHGTSLHVSRETMTQIPIPVLAIDGPAGVGKTSVSRAVAKALGYYFFSSGLIYRVMAWRVLQAGWKPGLEVPMEPLKDLQLSIGSDGSVELDGHPVTVDLHSEEISSGASIVSTVQAVRDLSNRIQRETVVRIGKQNAFPGVILEGRDIGTVVFPDAKHKIFLTASEEVRAQRRFLERSTADDGRSAKAVQAAIRERDQRDQNREVAPLKPATDALVIDTGTMTLEEVIQAVIARVSKNSG